MVRMKTMKRESFWNVAFQMFHTIDQVFQKCAQTTVCGTFKTSYIFYLIRCHPETEWQFGPGRAYTSFLWELRDKIQPYPDSIFAFALNFGLGFQSPTPSNFFARPFTASGNRNEHGDAEAFRRKDFDFWRSNVVLHATPSHVYTQALAPEAIICCPWFHTWWRRNAQSDCLSDNIPWFLSWMSCGDQSEFSPFLCIASTGVMWCHKKEKEKRCIRHTLQPSARPQTSVNSIDLMSTADAP